MRIILHPGADGAGDARLAAWLDLNRPALARCGIAVLDPGAACADGMLAGLVSALRPAPAPMGERRPRRSVGRIALGLARARAGRNPYADRDRTG